MNLDDKELTCQWHRPLDNYLHLYIYNYLFSIPTTTLFYNTESLSMFDPTLNLQLLED